MIDGWMDNNNDDKTDNKIRDIKMELIVNRCPNYKNFK